MHLKLSSRLILSSLLLSIVPIIIISAYAIHVTITEAEDGAEKQLKAEEQANLHAVNNYFEQLGKQAITMAEDRMIVNAMKDFTTTFDEVENDLGKQYDKDLAANESLLKERYVYQKNHTPEAPANAIGKWWPKDRAARILQHYYIAANPHPIGEKQNLDFAADGSRYSQIHRVIHPVLRSFIEKFEYYDIFLVEPITGRIVYTEAKEIDFATNLTTGPYSDSNLGKVFKAAAKDDEAGSLHFMDIEQYAPSFNKDASFIATPIFDGAIKIGVFIIQTNLDHLNTVMTNNNNWEEIGLGETGEAFLVGSDYFLRTESRRAIEDLPNFLQHLKHNGIADNIIKKIENNKTAIDYLEFQSPAVDAALSGKSGIMRITNYYGNPAVVAYSPLKFEGVSWALITTQEESEVFSTMYEMRNFILWIAVILVGLAAFIGWLIARSISNPISATINIISSSSAQMAATTAEQERIANQQAASVNETNTTMEELGISSKQSSQQAQSASEGTQTVLSLAGEGGQQVQEMLQGMENLREKVSAIAQQILKLSEQISQIGTITGTMTDFANETKMLAMNAAVEAVRAGEHGKGFSVLSVEIRKLAEESKRSAERINTLVEDVQKATNATVMATEEGTKTVEKTIDLAHTTAESFSSVAESMHSVSTNAQQISLNVKQQAEAIRQVVVAMNELKTGAREGAAGISQTKDGIRALNEAALKLKTMA